MRFMESYEDALRTIAHCYGQAIAVSGGLSLSRIATIVVNRGSFFKRLEDDTSFSARNLDKLASYFRSEENWPNRSIPEAAAAALFSIGRPPIAARSENRPDATGARVGNPHRERSAA